MKATVWQPRAELQIVVVCGTQNIEAVRTWAANAATRGQFTIVVGIVRSPITRCWYVGLSRQGDPLAWISIHRLKRDAEQQIPLVLSAGEQSDLRDDACWQNLLNDLAGRSEADLADPQAEPPVVSHRPRMHWRVKTRAPDDGT